LQFTRTHIALKISEKDVKMAIESLIAFGAATLVLLVISIYANKHRAEDQRTDKQGKDKE
jgi:hypothetical protein